MEKKWNAPAVIILINCLSFFLNPVQRDFSLLVVPTVQFNVFAGMETTALYKQLSHSSGLRRLQLLNDLASGQMSGDHQLARKTAEEACALCRTLYPRLFTKESPALPRKERSTIRRAAVRLAARSFANLGISLMRTGDFEEGTKNLHICMELATAAEDYSLQIRVLNNFGMSHLVCNSDIAQARAAMENALRIAIQAGEETGRAMTLTNISKVLIAAGEYEQSLPILTEALELHRAHGNRASEADVLSQFGQVYCINGDTGKALQALLEGLHIRDSLNYSHGQALSLMSIGNVYQTLGEYTEALQYQIKSLELYESLQDIRGMADALSNIGNIYRQTEDITAALEHYNRSLALRRTLHDKTGEATLLNNIGTAYAGMADFAASHTYLRHSLALYEECGEQNSSAIALLNIGLTFCDEGRYNAAHEYTSRALATFRATGSRHDEAAALLVLGKTCLKSGAHEEAIAFLHEALAVAEAARTQPLLHQIHESLSQAWERCGNHAQALQHYQRFHLLREQMFNDSSSRRLQALHVRYEVERSRKEAEMQRLDRERLERDMELKNRELTATTMLLAQKNDVLRELYDKVKEMKSMPDNRRAVRLRELILTLEDHLASRQTWEAFEQHFTQIHGTFYTSLLERCRELSPAELKVCALIRLNLTMKEIAALLAVTVMTVKKHRYNIRRKLGLEEGENLSTFMAGL